jgi:hypothetical protein
MLLATLFLLLLRPQGACCVKDEKPTMTRAWYCCPVDLGKVANATETLACLLFQPKEKELMVIVIDL